MNFYGVRELSNNTKSVLNTVSKNGTAIITDNGKPTALMIGITEDSFESVYALLQQMKARRAFEELQLRAQTDFPEGISDEEIEAEIQAVRKGE
ncbi:MAG: type II toxin-antitoxin system Phd/YefM family antitoxin [Candidatus Gallimonas sp.]